MKFDSFLPIWMKPRKSPTVVKTMNAILQDVKDSSKPGKYTYTNSVIGVQTDVSGDSFTTITLQVMRDTVCIGTMKIWHNRSGAFAHFNESQSYPLR